MKYKEFTVQFFIALITALARLRVPRGGGGEVSDYPPENPMSTNAHPLENAIAAYGEAWNRHDVAAIREILKDVYVDSMGFLRALGFTRVSL